MSDPLIKAEGITGATDLGDGRVVLILDLPRIAATASSPGRAARRGGTRHPGSRSGT